MMKIAVASQSGMVAEHWALRRVCDFDKNDQIVKSEFVSNPGHKPGFLPNFPRHGCNWLFRGMGGGAINIFNEKNIEVIVGARGKEQAAVKTT